MNQTILLDCDGVILDLSTEVHREAEAIFCRRLPPPEIWQHYRFSEAMNLSGREFGTLNAMLKANDNLARHVQLYPGAREFVLSLLEAGYEVVFVTKPWEGIVSWECDRRTMLRREFGALDVLFLPQKHRVIGTVLLDDLPETVRKNGARGLLFDRPWNRTEEAADLFRVHGYEEAFAEIARRMKHAENTPVEHVPCGVETPTSSATAQTASPT